MQLLTQDAPFSATLLVNQTAIHGIPAGINRLTEALLGTLGAAEPHVRVVNQPMDSVPGEQSVKIQEAAGQPSQGMATKLKRGWASWSCIWTPCMACSWRRRAMTCDCLAAGCAWLQLCLLHWVPQWLFNGRTGLRTGQAGPYQGRA